MKIDSCERKCRVLVFPCGSEIGLEIHRALAHSVHVALYGASSVASNPGRYCYQHYYGGLPFVDEPDFLARLQALVRELDIDIIFPAHDSVVLYLAQHADALPCAVATSPLSCCEVARDKRKTYAAVSDLICTPQCYDPSEEGLSFPLFIKPVIGQGSKGARCVQNRAEMDHCFAQDPDLLLMEYLPGEEFTIDCFSNKSGEILFVGARRRERILNGIAVDTVAAPSQAFHAMADQLNTTFQLRGAWFFQVKQRADGEAVLLEFAPRVSGSMGLYRAMGVNFPLLTVFDHMGHEVGVLAQSLPLRMDRALYPRFSLDLDYEAVYIDLDDTLIVDGLVNTQAVAFIFQCRNAGKQAYLISKHAACIEETLAQYRLENLFDRVFHLKPEEHKHRIIPTSKAIFIDDSYAERKAVAEACGIPTFAVDAIEALLDERS